MEEVVVKADLHLNVRLTKSVPESYLLVTETMISSLNGNGHSFSWLILRDILRGFEGTGRWVKQVEELRLLFLKKKKLIKSQFV